MSSPILGNLLGDLITWVRRIIKTSSDQDILDDTIKDYINRFYIYDMPARLQLFDLKRQYTFETIPNIFMYQFPITLYQGVKPPAYCDGIPLGYFQTDEQFYNVYPEFVNNQQNLDFGDNTTGPYTLTFGESPILRGFTDDLGNLLPYVYITAFDSGNTQIYIVDDGNGVLNQTDSTFQTILFANAGTVNYLTGVAQFFTLNPIPTGNPISAQTSPYSPGMPRAMLFFNNIFKLYPVPSRAHKIQIDCFVTPQQFLNTDDAIPFAYMSEYLARGAARKILSDNGDYEQFQFYEPLFREQENNVLRRSSRQNATQRTPTIFSARNTGTAYSFGFSSY
jgi:hypothetical protein